MNPIKERMKAVEREYEALPHGHERLAAIHEAIVEADASGDRIWRMRSRYDAVVEELFHGDSGKVLPLAVEVITLFEEQPIPSDALAYLWILDAAVGQWGHLPQLPLDQWQQLMKHYWEATQLYQKYDGEYYQRAFYRAEYQGQRDKMEELWEKWQKASDYNSCPGCKQRFRVSRAIACGDKAAAEREARPILDGTTPCNQEPEVTLSNLLDITMKCGTFDEAEALAKRLAVELKKETPYMDYDFAMLSWLAYKDPEEGLKMMERSMPDHWNSWSQSTRFYFLRGCWVLCRRIAEKGGSLRPLNLPEEFPLWRQDGQYEAPVLAGWFYDEAMKIARAFEARDGYPYYEKEMEAAEHFFQQTQSEERG